jgi:hypothetical protein
VSAFRFTSLISARARLDDMLFASLSFRIFRLKRMVTGPT